MRRVGAEIRLIEQRVCNGQTGLTIALVLQDTAQAAAVLARRSPRLNCLPAHNRYTDRTASTAPVAEMRQSGRAGVPVRNAVGRSVLDVEVAGRFGRRLASWQRCHCGRRNRLEFRIRRSVAKNSNCSAKPHIAHASPRVHVVNGEYPCCEFGQR